MAALVWDEIGTRFYETGVNKAVFYDERGLGVAWNGLTSVEQSVSNQVQAVHFDGLKFNDLVTVGDFTAVMRAWTYPDEFLPYEGTLQDQTGFFVADQPMNTFGLSYQTRIGNDIENAEFYGYKIHVLYNLTALPAQRLYQTMSLDTEPLEFEWTLTAIPEEIENFRPTAHLIFDSTKMDPLLLKDIESVLYGDEDSPPHLPSMKGLATFVRKWDRLIITDNLDGTWTAEAPHDDMPNGTEYIRMLDETTFEIISDTAVMIDSVSYNISSTEKNEEDIWLP